ncbi:hypothetical protein BGZ76_000771 [Entomortierella beljakovae]|nr:hypothetical protein BGZ76_000771 [Entomortierella beljakovae]
MSVSKNAFLATFKHLTRAGAGAGTRVPRVTKPIVSAPMYGWSGPPLVAAVANHGGFPIFPIGYFTDHNKVIDEMRSVLPLFKDPELQKDEALTSGESNFLPYGVGFITFWLDRQGPELLVKILEGRGDNPDRQFPPRPPAAVWFSFGNYKPYLKLVRDHGAPGTKVIVQVQSVEEALEAQQEHVDVIVLQGTEAGGHGSRRVWPLMTLVPETVQALSAKVASETDSQMTMPAILAAGGITTYDQMAAIHDLGASGAVIGTGFMTTNESVGSQKAKDLLLKTVDGSKSTVRTRIFDELRDFGWPEEFDGRALRNVVTRREEEDLKERGINEHKGADSFRLLKEDRTGTVQDWGRATKEQDYDLLPIFVGTGVGMLNKQVSAAEFIDQLVGDQYK